MKQKLISLAVLIGIMALGGFFRYYNLVWDGGFYLHPDERFLTMVGTAMKIPQSFIAYLTPSISTLNPGNVGYSFYVYGVFPLILNKLVAIQFNGDSYGPYGIIGRGLSGTFDLVTLLVVYKIGRLFEKEYHLKEPLALMAAFFYAIAVLPIQLSHFFATDTFMTAFMMLALYYSLVFALRQKWWAVPVAAVMFGLALACKVSAIYMLPLYLVCFYLGALKRTESKKEKHSKQLLLQYINSRSLFFTLIACAIFAVGAYLIVRLANPYYFQTTNFADITLNTTFVSNIEQLKGFDSYEGYFPPAIQWMSKQPTFIMQNLIVFGVGIPYAILMFIGAGYVLYRYRNLLVYSIVLWSIIFLAYSSFQFVKVMRYTIFVYPLLALYAGVGFLAVAKLVTKKRSLWLQAGMGVLVLIWPLMFMNIYMHKHSRVEASYWIYDNLPNGSYILTEHWDDGLPLLLPNYTKSFPGEQMEVFVPDSTEKFAKIDMQLAKGDYYIPTSNRAWGSIPAVPDKYPRMTSWYKRMFDGKLGYKKIKEFTSYPSLEWLGIPLTLPDQWADESFTVYDHPKVMIFENMGKQGR